MKINKIFSAHEHLGVGKLSFQNGTCAIYNARKELLENSLNSLCKVTKCEKLKVVLYPQMPYKKYSTKKEYSVDSEVINAMFFKEIEELSERYKYYPFIYLKCSDTIEKNEKLISKYRDKIYGIKLHPDAEMLGSEKVLRSGVLDLAKEYSLPITAHCSREGGAFDYECIRRDLLDEVISKKICFNIAHLGFGSKNFLEEELPQGIYTDLSPLGVIVDQYCRSGGNLDEFIQGVRRFISRNHQAIMYGGDYPYDNQIWEDGSVHGKNRIEDFEILNRIIKGYSTNEVDLLFYSNCQRFLKI